MIVRAAVVPHPPLLVPELVGGPDPDAERVRDACLAVVRELAEAAGRWIAVGAETGRTATTTVDPTAAGTFRGFGVDVPVRLTDTGTEVDPAMPLPALVAGWLRERAGAERVTVWLVPADLPTDDCVALGERLAAADDEPVGLLVLGDGSPRHGERAVGRPDERAAGFDDAVHKALAAADPSALRAVDPGLAAELGAVGRAPWQVLAGAAGARQWRARRGELLVPFGVAYHLAVWDPVR